MTSQYNGSICNTESDVEQKILFKLLTLMPPDGLGFLHEEVHTKSDIRKLPIDKGGGKKLYYPDYAIVVDGFPLLILEAKTPGSDLTDAFREARLYAHELNALYPKSLNPCERIVASDGRKLVAGFWDQADPEIEVDVADFVVTSEKFARLQQFASRSTAQARASALNSQIRKSATYFKPVHMLGGNSVRDAVVGDNSFGSNVSIEYRYLFNPDKAIERESVVRNAYVDSKRKQAHVAPIDKLIRAATPVTHESARLIENTTNPHEIVEQISNHDRVQNQICLLIGGAGVGKSTFTEYLRLVALPHLANTTAWIHLDLNKVTLDRTKIYSWIVATAIAKIKEQHQSIDFAGLDTIRKIFAKQLNDVERGKASLFAKDSERYAEVIYTEINRLQADRDATLIGMIEFLYTSRGRLLVIVLDNCDKRSREDQLLMFDVAAWMKNEFSCSLFLPLRDTTYDRYRNEPPLDTVIKDLVFRIDPPVLEKVIYARLKYALREIETDQKKFIYYLPNNMKVECQRSEVAAYLRSMISSLFQDQLFRRIITGLAGRNIRKGLEILLDFCKSGYLGTDELLKLRQSNGEYQVAHHLMMKILLKGTRHYYSDAHSNIKNLFTSNADDPLPNPFLRIAILKWLRNRFREPGPNRTIGFHKVGALMSALQASGHPVARLNEELSTLVEAGCIVSESLSNDLQHDDLVSLAPSGFVHLDLLRHISYLATVAEDVFFRENQPAKVIADNLVDQGRFRAESKQGAIDVATHLMQYLARYHNDHFVGRAKVLNEEATEDLVQIEELQLVVKRAAQNDLMLQTVERNETKYAPHSAVNAQVTAVHPVGIFVEWGLDGTGLIKRSRARQGNRPESSRVVVGDWLAVEILQYNFEHRKFDLKLIRAIDTPT